jgi:hypothetical protein
MNDPIFGKPIFTYTTKEAVEDGFLVEIDAEILSEAGIKFPVYLTRSVYDKYVSVPKELEHEQDFDGRLWDLLYMFAFKARNCSSSTVDFQFICRLPNKGDWEENEKRQSINPVQRLVTLHSEIRARDFDDPSPAIFIMKPHED